MEVIEKIQGDLIVKSIDSDPKDREKVVIQAFDVEFISFSEVAIDQAQEKHDVWMFDIVCKNIRNDLMNLDACIKALTK